LTLAKLITAPTLKPEKLDVSEIYSLPSPLKQIRKESKLPSTEPSATKKPTPPEASTPEERKGIRTQRKERKSSPTKLSVTEKEFATVTLALKIASLTINNCL